MWLQSSTYLSLGLPIWPTTFISPQNVLLAPSGPLRGKSVLSLVFTVVLVTDVLLQMDHVSGTTYLLVCGTRKSAAQNSEDYWKHSCFIRTAAHRDFFWLMRLINTLTYLLTYLHTLDGDFMSRKISRLTLIEWEEDATEQPVRSHDPADRLNKRAVVSRDVSNCQVSWILMSSHRLPIRESSSGGDAMRIQSRSNLCMSPTSIY